MHLLERMKKANSETEKLTAKDYWESRKMFIFEGAAAKTIFGLTSAAFLAGYASYLGADQSFNGIIGAIPNLAGAIQMFSPLFLEKLTRRKPIVSTCALIHRLSLAAMVFIPLITGNTTMRLVLLALIYLLSYSFNSFIVPAANNWIVSLTPSNMRGRYFGIRETYMTICFTVITLIMGRVLDIFKDAGKQFAGFIVLFSVVGILALLNYLFLLQIKEPPVKISETKYNLKSILTMPLKDKSFRKIVILFFLWNVSLQIGGPFFSVYQVTELELPYTFITIMSLISSATNAFVVRYWGKIADRKSWVFTTKASIGILAVAHMLWYFVDTRTAYYMLPFLSIMGGISWAGINISIFNIQFEFSPQEGRTIYLGFCSALGGIVGFSSTVMGSRLLKFLQSLNTVFLFNAGAMQVILALSGVLLVFCTLYIHFFIKDNKN
mgnify:FL=1